MRLFSCVLPACLAVLALPACLIDSPAAIGPAPPACACTTDRDCGGGAICETGPDGCGACRGIACLRDSDCRGDEVCDVARGLCEVPLGCDGAAPDEGCGPAEQCLVLDVAGCRAPPLGDTCSLWPPSRTLPGGDVVVSAVGRAADGRVVPASRATFVASGGVVGPGGDRDSMTLSLPACPGPDRCVVDVTATVGAARCQARYTVLPPAAIGDVRLIVTDADLGGVIAGADVVVVAAGSVVGGVTDDAGVFVAPGIGAGDLVGAGVDRVTVTAPGFTGFSCLGCDADLEVTLPRHVASDAVPAVGGRVEVGGPDVGDLIFGLAGLPLQEPSFGALSLFGAAGTIPVDIAGVTNPGDRMAFASAASLLLGTSAIRGDVVAFGRPGGRALWAFGAQLPLAIVGSIFAGGDDAPPRDLRLETLRVAGPRARGGLVGAVVPMPVAVPAGRGAALENLRGPGDAFVLADVDVAADVEVTLTGPLPPRTSDVLVIVGAVLPGEGLIPLGGAVLSARDKDTDVRGVLPPPARVPFSPPHDGLEGRALRVVAVAVDVDALIADDVLGQARLVAAIDAPAPGRALAVTFPAFPAPPTARLVGDALLVDDVGDTATLRVVLPGERGGAGHVVEVAGVTGTTGLADVLDDLEDVDVDVVRGEVRVGGVDRRFAPGRSRWDETLQETTPR